MKILMTFSLIFHLKWRGKNILKIIQGNICHYGQIENKYFFNVILIIL